MKTRDLAILEENRRSWNAMADSWFGTTALPVYGCLAPTEDELALFPPLDGARVLELGCGSGHSLAWCAKHGASELWGIDLSARQLENAERHLAGLGYKAKLFCCPMEDAPPEIPAARFDVVYAIYSIGWATDLTAVFDHAARWLKPGGSLIFSWDHPLMHCLETSEGELIFSGNYTRDETFSYIQRGQPVTVQNRRMSTYINALAAAGFAVERLIEESDPAVSARTVEFSSDYYSPWRASKFPLSFIIKARKI
ncbi:MAG: class I SAM-dependent methyltransferase [Ruminococcaceae bacterium]|nr:class I SAM-dependent methyltransferase [Oscillospiraceae bacterium]